jgi:hypothetical protein
MPGRMTWFATQLACAWVHAAMDVLTDECNAVSYALKTCSFQAAGLGDVLHKSQCKWLNSWQDRCARCAHFVFDVGGGSACLCRRSLGQRLEPFASTSTRAVARVDVVCSSFVAKLHCSLPLCTGQHWPAQALLTCVSPRQPGGMVDIPDPSPTCVCLPFPHGPSLHAPFALEEPWHECTS